MSTTIRLFIIIALVLAATNLEAAEPAAPAAETADGAERSSVWDQLTFGILWYLHGGYGVTDGESGSAFRVGRGYVFSAYKPTDWLESWATLDAYQDETGDLKVRLKYLFAKLKLPMETAVVTKPYLEVGVAHGPWLAFEEHINNYRMQGTMFQERNGLFNSADLGLTAGTLLGRELPEEYRKRVSRSFAGEWGSAAIGVYNGGGYHALEQNDNKLVAGRLSLRPLTFVFPNLQTSYMLYYGRGNTEAQPKWENHAFMLSVEHEYFVVTGTYAFGLGNQKGNKLTLAGNAMHYAGYSFFGELKLPMASSSIIGRYDRFDWGTRTADAGDPPSTRVIGGYAFHFLNKKNTILAEVDAVRDDVAGATWDWQARMTLQINFN